MVKGAFPKRLLRGRHKSKVVEVHGLREIIDLNFAGNRQYPFGNKFGKLSDFTIPFDRVGKIVHQRCFLKHRTRVRQFAGQTDELRHALSPKKWLPGQDSNLHGPVASVQHPQRTQRLSIFRHPAL